MSQNKKLDDIFTPDVICRGYLLYAIENSRHKGNEKLINFVLNEANDRQVIAAATKRIFLEGNVPAAESDIEFQKRVGDASKLIGDLASIAGGIVGTSMASKRIPSIANPTSIKGAFLGMASFMAFGGITSLVNKIIFSAIAKMKHKCEDVCMKTTQKNSLTFKDDINICIATCQLNGLKRIMSQLNNQLNQCDYQKNPEQCKSVIFKQLSKYRELVIKYEENLRKVKIKQAQARMKATSAAIKH